MKSTNKDMADSLFFWGISRIYKFGIGVAAVSWDAVSAKKKQRIEKETSAIAERIIRNSGNMRPSIKTRVFFNVMRMLHRKGWNEADVEYWNEKGWDGHDRPWKN